MANEPKVAEEPINLPERFLVSKRKEKPLTDGLTYRVKDILERRDKLYPEFKKPREQLLELEKKVAMLTAEIENLRSRPPADELKT